MFFLEEFWVLITVEWAILTFRCLTVRSADLGVVMMEAEGREVKVEGVVGGVGPRGEKEARID